MMAISTGELTHATLEIARNTLREAKGDRYQAAAIALKRLEAQGLLTDQERAQLESGKVSLLAFNSHVAPAAVGAEHPTMQRSGSA